MVEWEVTHRYVAENLCETQTVEFPLQTYQHQILPVPIA